MNWIPYPTTLTGETVTLLPLEKEHFSELEILAGDKRIWEFLSVDCSDSVKFRATLDSALEEREKGRQFPFVIYHNRLKKIIGSTRLMDIVPQHKKLEIGWTWLHPEYWASEVNPECKLLLQAFCFEQLQVVRVQLKVNEHNLRSRKAVEKIGGSFEGVLRNDLLRYDGTRMNYAYYSILDEEWDANKRKLLELYRSKTAETSARI